ncbi:MAG TPA: DUF6314 family protein [Waddliaceae bacterium]
MIEALCGNKNIQKALIFLFVNGKCYGMQLHRMLKIPLTPMQKALLRLEKGGIIMSYYEGKTRLYQFDPAFPLLPELEQLLKKAYTLLPSHEKKDYFVAKDDSLIQKANYGGKIKVLLELWKKLGAVKRLSFHAKTKSKEESGWNGRGTAEVIAAKDGDNVLIFHEKGNWKGKHGGEMNFSNIFRWTLDRMTGVISLEHLRRGFDHPVFLFYLAPSGSQSLASIDSHLCEGDAYFGQIIIDSHALRLNWRIIGQKKNEEINYHYS